MSGASPFRASELHWLVDEPAGGERVAQRPDLVQARRLVVPRGLCRFHRIDFPASLSAHAREQAARLHAEANSPYSSADFMIVRAPRSAAIWWWDRAAVERILGAERPYRAQDCVPESVLFAPGEGGRQIKTSDGYEAQVWREGLLVASAWRRTPFTDAQWRTFTAGAGEADVSAAPIAVAPDIDPRAARRMNSLQRPLGWADVARGALAFAALCVLSAAFLTAFGLRQSAIADGHDQARLALAAAADADPQARRIGADLAMARAYARQSDYVDALGAAAHGLSIVRGLGVEPMRWSVESGTFEVSYDTRTAAAPINAVAIALENDPRFEQVAPRVDTVDGVARVTARISDSSPERAP